MAIPADWYNANLPLRKQINLSNVDGFAATGTLINFYPGLSALIDENKIGDGFIVIAEQPDSATPPTFDTQTAYYDSSTGRVSFKLLSDYTKGTATKYYMYYGDIDNDLDLTNNSALSSSADFFNGVVGQNWRIAYVRPGRDWLDQETQKAGAIVRFKVDGPNVRIRANKGPDYGVMLFRFNSTDPWTEIELYNPTLLQDQIVYSTTSLDYKTYTLEVVCAGKPADGSGKNIAINFTDIEFDELFDVTLGDEEITQTNWVSVFGSSE